MIQKLIKRTKIYRDIYSYIEIYIYTYIDICNLLESYFPNIVVQL